MDNRRFVNYILEQAKVAPIRNYQVYEQYKKNLQDLCLSPEEFAEAIRKLTKILYL